MIVSNGLTRYRALQKRIFLSKVDFSYRVTNPSVFLAKHHEDIKHIVKQKLGEPICSIIPKPRSTLHYVYAVTTGRHEYIIRINAVDKIPSCHFIVEQWVTNELKRHRLPYLQIHTVDLSRKLVPFDYEIMEKAKGMSLYDLNQERGMNLDLVRRLGKLIANIHSIPTSKFGFLDIRSLLGGKAVGIDQRWSAYLLRNVKKHLDVCAKSRVLKRKEVQQIDEVLFGLKNVSIKHPVLLHGDVAHHNAFSDGKKITALIDWEDSVSGDPLYDIAYYATGCFGRENWLGAFLEGYSRISGKTDFFTKRYWLYYIRIAVTKAVSRIRFRSSHNTQLPNIKQRILYGLKEAVKS